MRKQTAETPVWVHFGAGNIFRGFVAMLQQELLNKGEATCGIIAGDTFDYDIIKKIYKPHDELTMMVGLKPDGTTEREIVASIADSVCADSTDAAEMEKAAENLRESLFADGQLHDYRKGLCAAQHSGRADAGGRRGHEGRSVRRTSCDEHGCGADV